MKTRTIIIWILALVIIDQSIKIFIHHFYWENHFEIIPSLIEFKPTFNVKHSWVNVLLNKNFGINVGLLPHVFLYLLIGIIVPMYSFYFKNNLPYKKKLIDTATIFMMAGIICALSGNIIWRNGTLDYLYLIPFFVFDLKDLYPDIGIILFLIYAFKNWVSINSLRVNIKHVLIDTKQRLKGKNKINAST